MGRKRVVIMGAAGRDFHNFNVVYRNDAGIEVVAFTAAQIPNITGRRYPPPLSGANHPDGIPIVGEESLETLIRDRDVDEVAFSYSDVSHADVMHKASRVVAAGARFVLLGTKETLLASVRPVISVTAVRTGAGKSPLTRHIASRLRSRGRRVAILRHPMPYGDLARQAVQRFETVDDLRRHHCTIEEREEYEPHLEAGFVVHAGVDYALVMREAERECDVILWDGGNNDVPFLDPDLQIVVADPHRAGDEAAFYPGEVNLLRADAVVIGKQDTARPAAVQAIRDAVRRANPRAAIIDGCMSIRLDDPDRVRGRTVLAIEDGPTVTHGGMAFGAAALGSLKAGAKELVDPRPAAAGSLRDVFDRYPHLDRVLPAMGYGDSQIRDLEATISGVRRDVTVVGTPADLTRFLRIDGEVTRARYEFQEIGGAVLDQLLEPFYAKVPCRTP